MSKYKYEGYGVVRDTEIDFPYHTDDIVELLDEKDQQISNLEAKLAERNIEIKAIEFWYSAYQGKQRDYDKVYAELKQSHSENEKIKQQLAEKEKEIETILKENEELAIKHNVYSYGDKIQQDKFYSITGEALELLINIQSQKAIEQLEKVKELLNTDFESIISRIDPYEDGGCLNSMTYNHNNTIKIIDNQIKSLKGGE